MKQIPDYVINERKREACEFLSDKNSTPSQRALARRFMKQHEGQTNVAK
tara:strand:- start:181 stop:327 length:147 start_codon:yes stop_codon:yes gene_type:complete